MHVSNRCHEHDSVDLNGLLSHQKSSETNRMMSMDQKSQRNEFHHDFQSTGEGIMYCENVFKAL